MLRVGIGYDVHRFESGRKLIIGGVEIPHLEGLAGHSDADVLVHAIMDAVLGALAKGDIGKNFPDTDDAFKDIDSRILLRRVFNIMDEEGYRIQNIDAVIIAQEPKMWPHIPKMLEYIAQDLHIEPSQLNIKATTTERLGFEGRREGITAQAIAALIRK